MIIEILTLFLVAIPLHEFGHYIGFKLYGYTPKIEFKWRKGTIEIGKNVRYNMTEKATYFMLLMGIFLGMFPMWILGNSVFFMGYCLMCCIDIAQLFSLNPKSNRIIIQYIRDSAKEAEIEYESEAKK